MTTLVRVCLASAVLAALAGAASAQAVTGNGTGLTAGQINGQGQQQSMIENYRPDPSTFFSQPGPWPSSLSKSSDRARFCGEDLASPGPAPKVVRTTPAPGSVVRPGAMVLSVTFDRPMSCKANLANGSPFPIPCPGDNAAVLMAPDRRTLTTVCQVEAGASYSMPIAEFVAEGGTKSQPYDLTFTTSNAPPLKDARQALHDEKSGQVASR